MTQEEILFNNMLKGSYRIIEEDGLFFCQSLTRKRFSFKQEWRTIKKTHGYISYEHARICMEKYIEWNEGPKEKSYKVVKEW